MSERVCTVEGEDVQVIDPCHHSNVRYVHNTLYGRFLFVFQILSLLLASVPLVVQAGKGFVFNVYFCGSHGRIFVPCTDAPAIPIANSLRRGKSLLGTFPFNQKGHEVHHGERNNSPFDQWFHIGFVPPKITRTTTAITMTTLPALANFVREPLERRRRRLSI